jgi:hypothetical protein
MCWSIRDLHIHCASSNHRGQDGQESEEGEESEESKEEVEEVAGATRHLRLWLEVTTMAARHAAIVFAFPMAVLGFNYD